jgi:2-amino-4-hydroxy-6-hydroxymethyldihydropteridine diphosphokinase
MKISGTSSIYKSAPIGGGRQPLYVNAVVAARFERGPARLLLILKRLERLAGRRPGRRWGPRPLDLDIIDYGGRRIGPWQSVRRPTLALPHPEAHRRVFVLVPIAAIAPQWRHPVLGMTGRQLLHRITLSERKQIRE